MGEDVYDSSHLHVNWSISENGVHCLTTQLLLFIIRSFCCCLVTKSCPTLCLFVTPWTAGHQTSLSFTISRSLRKLMSVESVMPSNHLTRRRPLLFLPSIFPSISVFSNQSVLPIRWPKYWSFGFSISPSSEYSGLISFRIDWSFMNNKWMSFEYHQSLLCINETVDFQTG